MTRYELLERIGAGGMAEIFRGKAVAAGGFEKPVAIKRILPTLSQDKRFVELLIAEANILSQLRHRNIVQIFDVGLGDDGQYFLVMEFVEGADVSLLQRTIEARRKRLPADLALHVGAEVCDALDYAHRARASDGKALRLVHRDVSPSNILLSKSGEVKLSDFGIAKRPEESTGHGGVRGKYAYIAPEQASNLHVDARSDVYALGIVLFELVTGRRLFSHLPDFDALRAVREGHVPRPREIDSSIAAELERILLKALAREPEDRYASAGELGAELRAFRYALPETGGDPASEIARIVRAIGGREEKKPARAPRGKRARFDLSEQEPTVVRIQTAAGFSTGMEARVLASPHARGDFDDEETRAMSRPPLEPSADLEALLGVQPVEHVDVELSEAETRLFDTSDVDEEGPATVETPTHEIQAMHEVQIAAALDRAATPTVRDFFHRGGMLDRDTPLGQGPPSTGAIVLPAPARPVVRRRGRVLLLSLAAVAVAAGSFVLAGTLLANGDDALPAASLVDAGVVDAASRTLEMPPDDLQVDAAPAKQTPQKRSKGSKGRKRRPPAR